MNCDDTLCQSHKAGIEVGDKLVEINEVNVLDAEHELVANRLRELRSNNIAPYFVLHRYPLMQGYQRISEPDSGDFLLHVEISINQNGLNNVSLTIPKCHT